MRFPSIKNLADNFINTVKRFPLEILFALAGTVAANIYINSTDSFSDSIYTKIIMVANLGLLLNLAATLFTESKGPKKRLLLRLVAALLAACLIFTFNHDLQIIDTLRFLLLSLAFHLLVSFAAFTAKGHIQGFWQFNKSLFLRFLAAVLYSGVLYLGLAAAIAASKFLFNLNIHDKTYGTLFVWIAGIFNTVFFLAGVPANTGALDEDQTYPKGLKVFTQYVLIPLASVYVLILLAYEVKILIHWSLPKGLVSNLILGYAVFGILSILLIYPLRNQEGNKWIKTYARSFYFLLIPLLVLLFLAITSRVFPYGITAPRYFLIILALWLVFITLYFLLSRKQNIKVIPISLCVVALLAVYGPQSAFSVSKYSQRHILVKIFKKYGAVKDGKFTSLSKTQLSRKDGEDVIEKVRYFIYNDDIGALQPYIKKDLSKVADSIIKTGKTKLDMRVDRNAHYFLEYQVKPAELDWMINYLGLNKFSNERYSSEITYNFAVENTNLLVLKGYDYSLSFGGYNRRRDADSVFHLKDENIRMVQTAAGNEVYTIYLNNDKFSFDVKSIADSLLKNERESGGQDYKENSGNFGYTTYTLPDSLLSFTKQTARYKVTFKIQDLRIGYTEGKEIAIYEVEGSYLISILK